MKNNLKVEKQKGRKVKKIEQQKRRILESNNLYQKLRKVKQYNIRKVKQQKVKINQCRKEEEKR